MRLFHLFHKKYTAIARFDRSDDCYIVLKCDKCGKYDVMTMSDMQALRHNFVIDVDTSRISMKGYIKDSNK